MITTGDYHRPRLSVGVYSFALSDNFTQTKSNPSRDFTMDFLLPFLRASKPVLAFHQTAYASTFTRRHTCHAATSPRRPFYTQTVRASASLDTSDGDVNDDPSRTTDQSPQPSLSSSDSETSTEPSRPNVKKYASQRSLISSGSKEVTPEEVNDLLVKAGKPVR